jgi:predicted DNA-binding transcriptional regulator AlpA
VFRSLIRWPEVHSRTSLSRATVDRYEQKDRFPHRVRIDPTNDAFNSPVAWFEDEIAHWIRSRVRTANHAGRKARESCASTADQDERGPAA